MKLKTQQTEFHCPGMDKSSSKPVVRKMTPEDWAKYGPKSEEPIYKKPFIPELQRKETEETDMGRVNKERADEVYKEHGVKVQGMTILMDEFGVTKNEARSALQVAYQKAKRKEKSTERKIAPSEKPEKLRGRKPATINKEFEEALQGQASQMVVNEPFEKAAQEMENTIAVNVQQEDIVRNSEDIILGHAGALAETLTDEFIADLKQQYFKKIEEMRALGRRLRNLNKLKEAIERLKEVS